MFEKFSKWWKRDELHKQELLSRFEQLAIEIKAEREHAQRLQDELTAVKQAQQVVETQLAEASQVLDMHRQQDEADEAKRTGTEPWVEIKSAEFNELKGIQIELDWNEAFVYYLRENGIAAKEDVGVVQKWVLMLYKDLMERLEHEVIEGSDKHFINDFE